MTAPVVEAALVLGGARPTAHVVEYVTPAPVEQIVDDPIPPLLRVIKTTKEEIERNEKRLAALAPLSPLSSSASSPGTDASCKKRLMMAMPIFCINIKSCSLQRLNWHLSGESCMRSADVLNTTEINVPA